MVGLIKAVLEGPGDHTAGFPISLTQGFYAPPLGLIKPAILALRVGPAQS